MKRILVVAAVIRQNDRILIARRADHQHQGGLWEFPGGKVESDESVETALARELHEELGITPVDAEPLIRIEHDYADKSVCLDVWTVSRFAGEPHGREGQPLRWVSVDELSHYAFPAANLPIVMAARLPDRYLITPDEMAAVDRQTWLAERLQQGARLVLFRAPSLSEQAYLEEAVSLRQLCHDAGARLMLHGHPDRLARVEADGIHVPAILLQQLASRPVERETLFAASVHDMAELRQAEQLGVDFVTMSPVAPTLSHPEAMPLGWPAFAELARRARVPVYALGGMSDDDVSRARRVGARGVAGIRTVFVPNQS